MATFVTLSEDDPALDLCQLVCELKYGAEQKAAKDSALAKFKGFVEKQQYSNVIEQCVFASMDEILSSKAEDINVVFNLSFSLLPVLQLGKAEASAVIKRFAECLTRDELHPLLKIKLLTTLFNQLEARNHEMRCTVFLNLSKFALATKQASVLAGRLGPVEGWIKLWSLDTQRTADLCLCLARISRENQNMKEHEKWLYKYFMSLEAADPVLLAQAKSYAAEAAIAAIQSPKLIQSDTLLGLAATRQLASSPETKNTYELLRIVATQDVRTYIQFSKSNQQYLTSIGVDQDVLLSKMRTLTLCDVGSAEPTVPYDRLQTMLQVSTDDEVENLVVDAVMAGHIDAKCDEEARVVHIQRVTARSFGRETWQQLSTKLSHWQDSVGHMLDALLQIRQDSQPADGGKL